MSEVITVVDNSENERLSINKITHGKFKGQYVLYVYDDERNPVAPHLLDKKTRDWLLKELPKL
jgi:hypothetical protein